MTTLFAVIIVLGVLIFVHEFGHFIVAKLAGVRVLKFSLGFGPALFGKKWGDTEYVLSAIPLGGFVKMYGENPDEQQIPAAKKNISFAHKPVWKRFLIVLAGPLFNLLFPFFLFLVVFFCVGTPILQDTTTVGLVIRESPAELAGIKKGDRIVAIGGKNVSGWVAIYTAVNESGGMPLSFVIERGGDNLSFTVQPKLQRGKNIFGEEKGAPRYQVGIQRADVTTYEKTGLVTAINNAFWQTWGYISLTVIGFVKIIQQEIPASELGGPILIAQIAGKQMAAGWINLVFFMGMLSVNLGILNLLPVPVLDGGHLFFLTIEALRRKPLSERMQIMAQQFGLCLLGSLMIFVFYNDIVRLFH